MSLPGDGPALITPTSQIFSRLPLFTYWKSLKNTPYAKVFSSRRNAQSMAEAAGSAAGFGVVGDRRVQWHRCGDCHRYSLHGHVHRLPRRIGFGAAADLGRQDGIE